MKRLICEVCGSTDIKKEDSVYICESCGCKYSIEDVKKLLVDDKIIQNENSNYNINHTVNERVEIVVQDNVVEEINKIIAAFDWDLNNLNTMDARITSWINNYDHFRRKGRYILHYPQIPETWLGLLYLQTMGFTFDRETCRDLCKQVGFICFIEDEIEGKYIYVDDARYKGWDHIYVYEDSSDEDYLVGYELDDESSAKWPQIPFYPIDTIMTYLKGFLNHPDITKEQKDRIKNYQKKYNQLVSDLRHEYAPKTATNNLSDSNSSNNSSNLSNQSSFYNSQNSEGCYIATAVYGSYDCPEVWTLRRYRDYYLAQTWYGRIFIRIYYLISPIMVRWFGNMEWFKSIWREKLDYMVKRLQSKGYSSKPYKDI